MKKLIVAFLVLLFAVWLGYMIHRDPGYILITYQKWSVETSLWVGIVALFFVFIIFYALLRLFRHTSRLAINLQTWNKERRERKAGDQTNQAFESLVEMQWKDAEELFSKAAKDSTNPVINYSAAAYAAQQQFALDRRNKYLTKLGKQANSVKKIAKLVESYFYIHSNQWTEALNALNFLQKKYPNDPAVLRFLIKTLEGLKDWDTIYELLPRIEKHTDAAEYKHLQVLVHSNLLENAIHPEWLERVWHNVPKELKTNAEILEIYAKKAKECRQDNVAVPVIENALKKNWTPSLLKYYGELESEHTQKQISHAESWLKKHPNDYDLLLCLGNLCLHEKLWGKAKDYLSKAIELNETSSAHYALGRLYEVTDDLETAFTHYRMAASTH